MPVDPGPRRPRAGANAAAATISSTADDLPAAAMPLRWNPAAAVSSAAGDLPAAAETKDRPRVESVNDEREHRADQISGRRLNEKNDGLKLTGPPLDPAQQCCDSTSTYRIAAAEFQSNGS